MMATSITMQLLDYTLDEEFSKARALCDEATVEIYTLVEKCGKQFTANQTQTIEKVRKIINTLVTNQTRSAKVYATSTTPMFSQHIVAIYFKCENRIKRIMATSISMQLLDFTIEGDFRKAKALCDEATVEINTLVEKCGKHFTDRQQQTIEEVRKVINSLFNNQTKSAKVIATSTTPRFFQHIVATYFKRESMEEVHPSDRSNGIQKHSHEQKGEDSRHFEQNMVSGRRMHTNRQSDGEVFQRDQRQMKEVHPSDRSRSIQKHSHEQKGEDTRHFEQDMVSGRRMHTNGQSDGEVFQREQRQMKEVHPSDRSRSIQKHNIHEQKGEDCQQNMVSGRRMHANRQSDGPRAAIGDNNQTETHQIGTHEEYQKNQAGKRASHALRLNNPDIPDLSDMNRPTKIAEKFSELYVIEWTEAFGSLSKTERSSEKAIVETLFNIVQDAYEFCREEADRQIDNLQSNCIEIFKGEKVSRSRMYMYTDPPYDRGREYLVKYRKDIAQLFLQDLPGKFKNVMKIKYSDERIIAYVDKAVELTWWMAVQDPPVYMCPTTTHFDSNLYKPYTRSGKTPDFFVWPALKLYKDGGLLMKGVVQYKN